MMSYHRRRLAAGTCRQRISTIRNQGYQIQYIHAEENNSKMNSICTYWRKTLLSIHRVVTKVGKHCLFVCLFAVVVDRPKQRLLLCRDVTSIIDGTSTV